MAVQLHYTGPGASLGAWVPGVPAEDHLQNDEDLAAALVAAPEGLYTVSSNFCVLPTNWNKGWLTKRALAIAGTGQANVGIWRDSIFQGYNTDDWVAHSVPGRLFTYLRSLGSEWAEYWPLADSAYGSSSTFTGTPPWVVNDTADATQCPFGLGSAFGVRWAGDPHPTHTLATLTTPVACTAIDLVYLGYFVASGATFTYTVDGGSTQTVNIPASSTNLQRVRITGLSSATHTVVITGQSADNAVVLLGAACYVAGTSGNGFGFVRMCQQGAAACGVTASGALPANENYQFIGGVNNANPSPFGYPTAPDLLIACIGINDPGNSFTAAQMGNAIRYAIAAQRLGNPGSSAMIVAQCQPDPAVTDVGTNSTQYTGYGAYREELTIVARESCAALVDYGSMMGSTPHAQGFIDTTHAPHLLTAGALAVANMITPLI